MNDQKEINNLKPVKGEQMELKELERAGARRKKAKETSGSRWAGLFLFIATILVSVFFYLKGGK
ncbi:hypothetical protein HZB78_05825 [Candidatus Collierbacteria bacterium]|nr:hypothetical protein [Candidatus Collierbacteria bacterium]